VCGALGVPAVFCEEAVSVPPVIADPPLRKENGGEEHPRTWSSQAGPSAGVRFKRETVTLNTPWSLAIGSYLYKSPKTPYSSINNQIDSDYVNRMVVLKSIPSQ
jgi:hypothetical protein